MSAVLSNLSTSAMAKPLPPVRRPSLVQLTGIELRKTVDTRAGRLLLAALVLLSLVAIGYKFFTAQADGLEYTQWAGPALISTFLLLPVLGVLAMSSEWTQRTALTTFTLTPRRLRVLTAKLVAAALLGALVTLVVDVMAVAGLAARAGIVGADADWSKLGTAVAGSMVATALGVLMGAAFGALLMQSAAAIVAYFVAPNVALIGAAVLLGEDRARWVDVQSSFGRLQSFELEGQGWQTLTSLVLWIALPLALGLWRSVRRNVS